jgi:hypothetical protein
MAQTSAGVEKSFRPKRAAKRQGEMKTQTFPRDAIKPEISQRIMDHNARITFNPTPL